MQRAARQLSARRVLCIAAPAIALGGAVLYDRRRTRLTHREILNSPALIPCRTLNPTILSPSEDHLTIRGSILDLLRDNIWEPIRTTVRFLRLFALFFPVIVTSPMILVGRPQKQHKGERWGAVWWYGYLVQQMEAAGPTFIKVGRPSDWFQMK